MASKVKVTHPEITKKKKKKTGEEQNAKCKNQRSVSSNVYRLKRGPGLSVALYGADAWLARMKRKKLSKAYIMAGTESVAKRKEEKPTVFFMLPRKHALSTRWRTRTTITRN